jgi:hypothetical protein
MPTLPSGRRIEFSLDRFHAMLEMLPAEQATGLVDALDDPDDLLWILDLVTFDATGRPHFAQCLAADWRDIALEWSSADRTAFADYLLSEVSRDYRVEAIEGTRLLISRINTEHLLPATRLAA